MDKTLLYPAGKDWDLGQLDQAVVVTASKRHSQARYLFSYYTSFF